MYYAIYHVATTLVGSMAHGEFPDALDEVRFGLGVQFKRLAELRSRADYSPDFVAFEFGDYKGFRSQFPNLMADARKLYEELVKVVKDGDGDDRP